jgi:hypothetical protein
MGRAKPAETPRPALVWPAERTYKAKRGGEGADPSVCDGVGQTGRGTSPSPRLARWAHIQGKEGGRGRALLSVTRRAKPAVAPRPALIWPAERTYKVKRGGEGVGPS